MIKTTVYIDIGYVNGVNNNILDYETLSWQSGKKSQKKNKIHRRREWRKTFTLELDKHNQGLGGIIGLKS